MQDEIWFQPLIWMDYRLAILFTVMIPLVLIIWAAYKRAEAIARLLIIYWRVASLLMITVYLMIPSWPISFATGTIARLLIPISLWFWVDVNEEIDDRPPDALKLATTAWRWSISTYCLLGVLASLPFLPCAFQLTETCKVWFEPPWGYYHLVHFEEGYKNLGVLGFCGAFALCCYIVYFAYFLLIRLGRQGRSAMPD